MSNIGYAVLVFKKMEADRIRPQGAAFAVGKHVRKLQELGYIASHESFFYKISNKGLYEIKD